jgi:hypothetical protein
VERKFKRKISKFEGGNFTGVLNTFRLLETRDNVKLLLVSLFQVLLSIIELFGIALIGMLVVLATTSQNSSTPGYVSVILRQTQIDQFNLQTQFLLIGFLATFLLSLKSVMMVITLRKIAYFLSRRSAELSKVLLSKLLTSSLEDLEIYLRGRVERLPEVEIKKPIEIKPPTNIDKLKAIQDKIMS